MTPSDGTTVPPVLSISQLYDRVDAALNSTFGGKSGLWVEGEIAKISGSNGHCYVDLVDPAERGPGRVCSVASAGSPPGDPFNGPSQQRASR